MVWVVDARDFIGNMDFRRKDGGVYTFRWKHPRKIWATAKRPVYLDPGDEGEWAYWLFRLRKVYPESPCGGWGIWSTRQTFLDFFGQLTKDERREQFNAWLAEQGGAHGVA